MASCDDCGQKLSAQFRSLHPASPYCAACLDERRNRPQGSEQPEYVARPVSPNRVKFKDIVGLMSKHGLLTKAAYRDPKQFRRECQEFAKKHGLKTWGELRNYLVAISGTVGTSNE